MFLFFLSSCLILTTFKLKFKFLDKILFKQSDKFKDLNFLHAGVLVGSVISRPSEDVICLNFGHKSVASEMEFPRLKLLNMKNFKQISHSGNISYVNVKKEIILMLVISVMLFQCTFALQFLSIKKY